MLELPKSVLQRLRASAAQGEHPAADLLAAFAENSLKGAEREQMLAHLAACEPCREVVWYTQPKNESGQVVVTARRGWRWSSTWRWAGVAAGIVVLAGVASLFRGGPGPAGERAVSGPQVLAPQPSAPAAAVKEAAPTPSQEARLETRNAPAKAAIRARLDKQAVAQPKAGLMAKNEGLKEPRAEQSTDQLAPGPLARSGDEIALKDEARVPAVPAAKAASATNSLSGANTVAAAKTAPVSTAEAGVMIASNIPARDVGKKKLAPPTRWMLSSEGALLRSTDAGENWQAVPFSGNVDFHAIAVVGPRVWVGGRGGTLYYSADDGSQWQRLSASADGVLLSDDISSLSFRDNQNGTLTTASGQTWSTSDGGQSWHKQ